MSTISVSNIITANGSEPLTVTTGNTLSGKVVIRPNGGVVISQNSSVNSIVIDTNTIANVFVTNSSGIYFVGNASISGNNHSITGNVNIDSGALFIDGVNNRVGVLNTTPDASLTITGTANVSGNVIFSSNLTVTNYVTANVFVGAAQNPFNPRIANLVSTVGSLMAPSLTTNAAGTLTLSAAQLYFIPLYVPSVFTTNTLACEVTTLGSGSSIRMNIYASSSAGFPDGAPLSTDVLVNSASTGVKTGQFVTTLKPGLYWAAMLCSTTAPTIRSIVAPATIGTSVLGATPMYSYIWRSVAFGVMPSTNSSFYYTGIAPATQTPMIAIY